MKIRRGRDPRFSSRSGVPSNAEKVCGGLKTLPKPLKPKTGRGDEDGAHCRSCPLSGPGSVAVVAVSGPAVVDSVPSLVGLLSGRENLVVVAPSPMGWPPGGDPPGVSRPLPSSFDTDVAVPTPRPTPNIWDILYSRRP